MEERFYSVSAIQAYLACPLKYRFQYLDKLRKAFRPAGLAFGTSVHSAIEWFHRLQLYGRTPRIEEVLEVFEADWFAQNLEPLDYHAGESEHVLAAKAKALLTLYLEAQGSPPVAIEEPFELELADPETGELLGVPLRGTVDRIEADGTLVDLKTAARNVSDSDLERHLQLSTYALVSFLKTGSIPKLRLDVLLKTKQPRLERHTTSRCVSDLAWVAYLIRGAAEAIEEGQFYPNPSWRCSECEYFAHCQAWRGRQHRRVQGNLVPLKELSATQLVSRVSGRCAGNPF